MNDERDYIASRSADLQQRWHGWGSPVGLSLGFFFTMAGIAVLLFGIAAL